MVHLVGEVRDILGPVEGAKVAFRSKADYPVAEGIMVSSPAQVTTKNGKVTADLDEGPAVMMVQAPGDSFYREFPMIVKSGDSLNNALVRGGLEVKPDTPLIEVEGPRGPRGYKGEQGDTGPRGPQGVKGATGDTGPRGPQGDTGPQGPIGKTGPVGPKGQDGTVKFDSLTQVQKDSLRGEKGPKGDVGPKGDQGEKGPTGPEGPKGATGSQGPRGPAGPTGPKGDQGERGEQGPKGTVEPGEVVPLPREEIDLSGALKDATGDATMVVNGGVATIHLNIVPNFSGRSRVISYTDWPWQYNCPRWMYSSLVSVSDDDFGLIQLASNNLYLMNVEAGKTYRGTLTYALEVDVSAMSGPQGPQGPKGEPGTTEWGELNGKPSKFPPENHKHVVADVTDLPKIDTNVTGGALVQRYNNGAVLVPDPPPTSTSATSKSYVDSAVNNKADKSHKHTMADISDLPEIGFSEGKLAKYAADGSLVVKDAGSHNTAASRGYVNSRIQLVSSLPSKPESDVLYVIAE